MWCSRLNELIRAIDSSIPTIGFDAYTRSVDALCTELHQDAADDMGPAPAMLFLLKISNLLIAKYEFFNRHVILISHPVGLLIDPSNGCPLECPGCVHSAGVEHWDWPSGLIKPACFSHFLDMHGPFAIDLYLANYGEPFLNASTPKYISQARAYGLPTFTSTSLSVPTRLLKGVVESGLNFLIMSIDGATSATYSQFRKKGDLDLVLQNVKYLVETKKKTGSYTPVLSWQFLVFEHNAHEMELVERTARDLEVNQLALAKPFAVDWDDPSIKVQSDWQSKTITFHRDEWAYRRHLRRMRSNLATDTIAAQFRVSWDQRRRSAAAKGQLAPSFGNPSYLLKQCGWLYKSLSLDAHGRVLPCARPPSKTGDLIFSSHDDPDHFNSTRHQLARQLSTNRSAYDRQTRNSTRPKPYCEICEHREMKPDIDTLGIVRQHLYDFDLYEAVEPGCKDLISEW